MRKLGRLVATLGFIGYSPFASGTLASAVSVAVYLLIKGNVFLYYVFTAATLALGFWASSVAEKEFNRKDPHEIVIDEFSSMLIVYLFVPANAKFIVTGFLLFRFFDILKPPPLRKLQSIPGGWGIMLDDIAAAIFVNIALQVLRIIAF